MASISANGAKGHHKFTLEVTQKSQDTAKNTSTVSFAFKLSPIQTSWDWSSWGSYISYSININGTTYTGTIPNYDGSSTVTLKSGTQTVSHNADGTKQIPYSFSVTDKANKTYTCGAASANGTLTLTTIPRQATLLTAPNFSDGDNPTITYSNPAGNSVTALEACISLTGETDDIAYRPISKTGTSYTFELTDDEREVLRNAAPNSNTINVQFFLRTKIGNSTYWSALKRTLSLIVICPIITATAEDQNGTVTALTGSPQKIVKYHSDVAVSMSATAQNGASIDENLYIIRNGDNTRYGTQGDFENVESNEFVFSAEDSRGNIGEKTITLEMVDYIKLTCNIANNRPDALGNMTVACTGSYFNGGFGVANNTLKVQCRYAKTGYGFTDNWADMKVTITGNSYYASLDFVIPDFNQQQSYSFETRAIDALETISSKESSVKSTPIFHWGENDFVFEVPVTFNAGSNGSFGEGDKTITGDLYLRGDSNYGNRIIFGDGEYVYIGELKDDEITVNANYINLEANGVYVNGRVIPVLDKGRWTPTLDSYAISYYTTQEGWYSKVGQTVTVGFFIKATCNSGYQSTSISIYGLPFTPMWSAVGGGMCSGAYVSGGFDFQCFVADTGKTITTRVQACNNTSATNLSTSASGCNYRNGGGEITLSGTITFMSRE
jgi:hypothetical protein